MEALEKKYSHCTKCKQPIEQFTEHGMEFQLGKCESCYLDSANSIRSTLARKVIPIATQKPKICECGKEIPSIEVAGETFNIANKCPECSKIAEREEQRKIEERKHELEQEHMRDRMNAQDMLLESSGVPKKFINCSLGDFNPPLPEDPPAYIHGPAGTGKTHMAVAYVRKALITDGKQVRYVRAVELYRRLREANRQDAKEYESDILREYQTVDYLVIDDLGVEKRSEWVMQVVYDLIDRRYVDMRPITVTSNMNLKEFSEAYGERMASRLIEMGRILNLNGKNWRMEKKK